MTKQFKSEIKIPKYHRISPSSPNGSSIQFFSFFQTNIWDTFSSRLDLDEIELLYDLGSFYHNLTVFNEAVRIESTGERRLSFLLQKHPNFLNEIEQEIKELISKLESII